MHASSMANMQKFVEKYISPDVNMTIKIADIGSQMIPGQGQSYKTLFARSNMQYVGVDVVAGENVDIHLKNPYLWNEIKSEYFDVVISGQALEHVEYVWVTILEIARVLKGGGLLCIVVPSAGPKHSYPVDCYRYFDDGLRALAKWARLDVLEVYTQNKDSTDPNKNITWQDSVIVCRKPHRRLLSKIKFAVANKACRTIVRNLVKDS